MNNIDYAIRNWALRRNACEELFLPDVGFLSVVQVRPTQIIEQSTGVHQRLIAPFYALQINMMQTMTGAVHVADLIAKSLSISPDAAQQQYDNWLSGQLYADPGTVAIEAMMVVEFSPTGQIAIGEVDPLFEQMLNPIISPIAIDPVRISLQVGISHRGGIRKTNPSKIYIVLAIIAGSLSLLLLAYMIIPDGLPLKQFLDGLIKQLF